MKPRLPVFLAAALAIAFIASGSASRAQQVYRNIVNTRFRTVSNGPQNALIVDVKNLNDRQEIETAVRRSYSAMAQRRNASVQKYRAQLVRSHRLKPNQPIVLVDTVILRSNGKPALPAAGSRKATRAGGGLTFTFPITGANAWDNATATSLAAIENQIYQAYYGPTGILGYPWVNGTTNVTVLSKDPYLNQQQGIFGAVFVLNGSNMEIWFPTFSTYDSQFLAMAQAIALAFHGSARTAYDSWEHGMARAAAVAATVTIRPKGLDGLYVDPSNSFFYTSDYDALNEPALGNSTFLPPTEAALPSNPLLSDMFLPRLQMSSTAWLKCYIEDNNFFRNFNANYWTAYQGSPSVANDITQLRAIAKASLIQGNVEGQDFDSWYERQYVLDTSVTVGPKLYVWFSPTLASGSTDVGGASFVLLYYQTTAAGDELVKSGTSYPIYWSFDFANRYSFGSGTDQVAITNGAGYTEPEFNGTGNAVQRIAVDFPVNKEYQRIYFPAGAPGTEAAPAGFYGSVVGANTGALAADFEGAAFNATIQNGAFGTTTANIPNGFRRAKLTYTPTGGAPIVYYRNVYVRPDVDQANLEVSPGFVLVAPGPTTTVSHSFTSDVQMFSIPVQPLTSDVAKLLGLDTTRALLAQWRQDATGTDKYQRYPTLPRYLPGYSLWGNFQNPGNNALAVSILGQNTDIQQDISVPLQYGWTQIGSPYTSDLTYTTDANTSLYIQYLNNDPVTLSDAIAAGWVAAGILAYDPSTGSMVDITQSGTTAIPQNTIKAWSGYWIRVLATEGVTLTYVNPVSRAASRVAKAAARRSSTKPNDLGGWRIPISIRDAVGNAAVSVFGQSPRGAESFVPSLDVASPPPLSRSAALTATFPHADWDTGYGVGGSFLSDVRRTASRSQWTLTVTVPQSEQTYTLTWGSLATLPRGTHLSIQDLTSKTTQVMNNSSALSFQTAKGETTRQFLITAVPRSANRLAIRNLSATTPLQTGGRAANVVVTVSYELTVAAETQVQVRLAGRVIRHVAQGRAASEGVNQLVWDGRDDSGRVMSAGTYLLEVTARTPDGEQTRSIAPIILTR